MQYVNQSAETPLSIAAGRLDVGIWQATHTAYMYGAKSNGEPWSSFATASEQARSEIGKSIGALFTDAAQGTLQQEAIPARERTAAAHVVAAATSYVRTVLNTNWAAVYRNDMSRERLYGSPAPGEDHDMQLPTLLTQIRDVAGAFGVDLPRDFADLQWQVVLTTGKTSLDRAITSAQEFAREYPWSAGSRADHSALVREITTASKSGAADVARNFAAVHSHLERLVNKLPENQMVGLTPTQPKALRARSLASEFASAYTRGGIPQLAVAPQARGITSLQ